MCGIAGFFEPSAERPQDSCEQLVTRMTDALSHRGPDDRGIWADASHGIALGQRRLAVIDLSPAGHQPMESASGRYVITYNGEIFNWEDLRAELPPPEGGYRGHSDTEIFLQACEVWGVEAAIAKLIGFFAIALWDRQEKTLLLVRDRLGIKPLYWSWQGGGLFFGSELAALRAHPACRADIDRDALTAYLRTATVPAPLSIFAGIRKLEAGTMLRIRDGSAPAITRFWDLRDAIAAGAADRAKALAPDALAEWETLLADSVRRRMIADVPLGAFLSGGIDSSAIVALMQKQSTRPVKTFAIGFHEKGYDEAPYARAVAKHLGTEHQEIYVGAAEALAMVPRLAQIYDEPFADSSQIPTALICQAARRDVTVALSGDGGDEVFAGYNRYRLAERSWPRIAGLPSALRGLAASGLRSLPPSAWDRLLAPITPRGMGQIGDKLGKAALMLESRDLDGFYLKLISQWQDPAGLILGRHEPARLPTGISGALSAAERFQAYDMLTYLADDILTKVDRASMAVALEVRVPFLDHRIIEKSWHLPMSAKLGTLGSKTLLRQIAYRHVPRALLDRPKMGFGVPIDHWLRGPLKDWAAALISPARLKAEGLLRAEPIWKAWEEHQSGRRNHQYALWTVLMFQAWKERWV